MAGDDQAGPSNPSPLLAGASAAQLLGHGGGLGHLDASALEQHVRSPLLAVFAPGVDAVVSDGRSD